MKMLVYIFDTNKGGIKMGKKVRIDPDLCVGDAICTDIAPDVFEMGDDGLAHVKAGMECTGDREDVQEAAEQCPGGAIIIEDSEEC